MDVRGLIARLIRSPDSRSYTLDKERALRVVREALSRSPLSNTERAVILAFYARDGLPARQLTLSSILVRTRQLDPDDAMAACAALCDMRMLWKVRGAFGEASYLLDPDVLKTVVSSN